MAYEAWTVEIEYAAGVWTNVTSRVDTANDPFDTISGDTPESSADTGGFTLPLQNSDQAFTPGNQLSALALEPGLRVRIRETIGDRVFERAAGYTAYPEIEAWTESNATEPRDQLLMLPVIDRAAWIAQGRALISTLAEHIIYNGGTALVAYWPLNETEGPDAYPAVGGPWALSQTLRTVGGGNASSAGPPSITYGSGGIAFADDLSSIAFDPSFAVDPINEYDGSVVLRGNRPTSLTLAAGRVVTIVCWMRPTDLIPASSASLPLKLKSSTNDDVVVEVQFGGGGTNVIGGFGANDADWSGDVLNGPPIPTDQAIPVAVRVGVSPSVLELWVRSEIYTDTLTVVTPTSATFDQVEIGDNYPGAINHVQVYLGAAADWTNDDFIAQYEMGMYGLERQTTGERIRTVLQYAGVDPSELGRVDDGSSLMQVARMAGTNPMDLVAEAVATEQGEFYIAGDNRPVFAGRVRLLNV